MNGFEPQIHPPERVTLTCPLGLQFLDVATGASIRDGLRAMAMPAFPEAQIERQARAWRAGKPTIGISSVATPSGIHAFHNLPGLRRFENSDAADPWMPPPPEREFRIEVADLERRFLPCTFIVRAPILGLSSLFGNSSPSRFPARAIPLFSAPWRPAVPGFAVVRADLRRDLATDRPAAWAFAEVAYASAGTKRTAYGLADAKGSMAIFLPYPEGQRHTFENSPPAGTTQQWPLSLSFFCDLTAEPELVADYAIRLHQPAVPASRGESPGGAVSEETLALGRETVLGLLELTAT